MINRDKATEKEIALGIHKGDIFTNRHVRDVKDLTMVFMILSFIDDEEQMMEIKKIMKIKEIGMIYEYVDQAISMSVNGYPTFGSMRILTKEQTKKVWKYVEQYRKAEGSV